MKINDKRNMLITYDNIIQSTDYGFIDYLIYNIDWQKSKLKFEPIIRAMTLKETVYFLNNRPEEDLFKFLSGGLYDKYQSGIDLKQNDKEFFKHYVISDFANRLPLLLSSNSIDKLYIAVDTNNQYKLKILLEILNEYQDRTLIVDENELDDYIGKPQINTIFSTDEILYKNIDKLEGKGIMINDVEYIYEILNSEDVINTKIDNKNIVKITKNHWEGHTELDISFIKPFKYSRLRKLMLK